MYLYIQHIAPSGGETQKIWKQIIGERMLWCRTIVVRWQLGERELQSEQWQALPQQWQSR